MIFSTALIVPMPVCKEINKISACLRSCVAEIAEKSEDLTIANANSQSQIWSWSCCQKTVMMPELITSINKECFDGSSEST